MKGVLGWIKSHLIMVISTVVIVVSLPLGWVFSSGMNKTIRETQEKRASQAHNQVNSAKVTYVIPSVLPDEPAWSESRVPNKQLTEFVKAEREKRLSQASTIVDTVLEFNQSNHAILATSLLPEPTGAGQGSRPRYEFLARMAGERRTGQETIYKELIASIGAGEPPDPVRLATTIQDLRDRETERMQAEAGAGTVSAEQQETLDKLLADRRMAETQRRAKEVSVYLTLDAFDPEAYPEGSAQIPPVDRDDRDRTQAPSLAEVFSWNFDYWVVSDLLRAIDAANTDAGGLRANVENAVVKRVERIGIEALPIQNAGAEEPEDNNSWGNNDDDEIMVSGPGVDPSVSVTGRVTNAEFDVVNAKLTMVVDAGELPRLFQSFAETNLMTVLDMDITEVDLWEDLRKGYYYGRDPVVRVDLEIETVWHRDWTADLMPQVVRDELGIVNEDEFGGEG